MADNMADVTLHIDENTSHDERENFRNSMLNRNGVMAAAYHDEKPHLLIIEYNPEIINSSEFVKVAQDSGLHAELIGL